MYVAVQNEQPLAKNQKSAWLWYLYKTIRICLIRLTLQVLYFLLQQSQEKMNFLRFYFSPNTCVRNQIWSCKVGQGQPGIIICADLVWLTSLILHYYLTRPLAFWFKRWFLKCLTLYGVPIRDMRLPTMWYVWPVKPEISMRIRAVWSEPLLVVWIFYEC